MESKSVFGQVLNVLPLPYYLSYALWAVLLFLFDLYKALGPGNLGG